jgi:hypothetical protein
MKWIKWLLLVILSITTSILIILGSDGSKRAIAKSEIPEIPEEILRTEIILSARSPINGQPLTATEYAELQKQLQVIPPPRLDAGIRDRIFLLRIRKAILQFLPFLDI